MMRHVIILAALLITTAGLAAEKPQNFWDPNYKVSEETAKAIEEALPDKPVVKPPRLRKLLVYGRVPTHPGSVACCFKAIEAMGKKTGAFETVSSGDPLVFLPENLKQFDAVLMNNTHESHPMLPIDFAKLTQEQQVAAQAREAMLQKSLLDFVTAGKGVIGIHAAVATGWKDYLEMMGGPFGGHVTGKVWIKPADPEHPLCAMLNGKSFEVEDEIYVSTAPEFRKGLRVLLSLDLQKTADPGKRSDGDYVVSWVRPYHRGRVFYCSLGHEASSYSNPQVLRHYLAGIQFALGDLEADAAPRYRIFWGDTHTHTNLSDGKGTPDEVLAFARDTAKLDFVMLTDHDFGNGPPWRMSRQAWNQIQDAVDQRTVPGKFVAIAGYEWTSQAKYWTDVEPDKPSERLFPGPPKFYNHKNVYFPACIDQVLSAKDRAYFTPDLLAEAVRKHGGLIQNNHPFAYGDTETRDQWEYDPRHADVIVNTEMGPDVNRYQGKTYELNWEKTVRAFLKTGRRTGLVGGSDTHECRPAARTAVLAEVLTRGAIFDAMRNRRNYAITNGRIEMDFRINGLPMGQEIATDRNPRIEVRVRGTAPLKEMAIIRDGSVLHRVAPNGKQAKFEYIDKKFGESAWYYLRVEQADEDEHGNPSRAWSSPIWVRPMPSR